MFPRFLIGFWHLWYLSGLVGAALILMVMQKASPAILGISSALTFSTGVLIQYSGHYHWIDNPYIDHLFNLPWFHRNFLLFSFPFFVSAF